MLYVILAPVAVIATVLGYLALQPGEIRVRRSMLIKRDRADVFNEVRDFRTWPQWSPWMLHEPDARLEQGDAPDQQGSWYAWDGKLIGAGRITHLRLDVPERIEQRITFTRPFKSTSAVSWEFVEHPSGTEVVWSMRGRMPFMLRFLAPIISAGIDKDYEIGLVLLRARLDPSADRLRIRFIGETEYAEQSALTIPFQGSLDAMVAAMKQGLPRLATAAAKRGIVADRALFAAYHKADPTRDHFECDIALPVPEGTDPGEFAMRRLGGGRYYLAEVQGSYDFLAPAWYSIMGHLRMAKLNWDRRRPSLEVYAVDPGTAADSNDILTRIYVPIR